jgi:hypothetical protein
MRLKIVPLMMLLVIAFVSCKRSGYDYSHGFDNGLPISKITVDTNMSFVDVSMYQRARIFPGLVGTGVQRLLNIDKTFDFSYDDSISSEKLRVNVVPKPVFSTGFYAPAGELVKVIVPQGVSGLTLQIGAHTDDISSLAVQRRGSLIYSLKELFPGVNYLRNLYGGVVWIKSKKSIDIPVTLNISGVVEMADFQLGRDSHSEWFQRVKDSDVPWLELKSKRTIYTVPRYMMLRMHELGNLGNLEDVMQEWDRVYEQDFYGWLGLEFDAVDIRHRAPDLPERGVLDIHPVAGYAHSGYPWVAQLDDYWTDEWVNIRTITGGGAWGTYHEIGHNYQQGSIWSWPSLGETTNNLFVFKGANRNNTFPTMATLRTQIPLALNFAASSANNKVFENNSDPFFKLTPFLQIFDLVSNPTTNQNGWGFMSYLNKLARVHNRISNNDQDRKDFLYEKLCDYTQMDYAKFFDAWGIQISAQSKQIIINKGYPSISKEIWKYNPITKTGGNTTIPVVNNGLTLFGGSAAQLANNELFNFGVKPNITLQVTLKAPSGAFYYPTVVSKKGQSLGAGGWEIFSAGSSWELRANNMSPGWIVAGAFNDAQWHVITVVFDGANSKIRIYRDGVFMNEGTMNNNTLSDNNFPFRLGQIAGYNNVNHKVLFKELRIFNKAFTAEEMSEYGCLPKITSSHSNYGNLIGYWKINETSGTVIKSEISPAHNFTIVGANYNWSSFTDLPNKLCN